MSKAYNVVRNWKTGEILYTTYKGLSDACDWMMKRINDLDIKETSADEILENGELGGSWFISDLLENSPNGWTLSDGTMILANV